MHLRQGKYSEAAESFETELRLITGDLGPDSSVSDLNSSTASNSTMEGASREQDVSSGGHAETRNVTALNGSAVPVPAPHSNDTAAAVSNGTDTAAAAGRVLAAAPIARKEKVMTAQEKAKAKALHMKLGKIYATQLLDVSAAASHYERAMDLGGDLDRDMRTFFAKNALELSASAKAKREADERQQGRERDGEAGGVGGEKAEIGVNSTSTGTLSNNSSSNSNSNSSSSSGSADQSSPLGAKAPVVPKPDPLAPSSPPRLTERAGFRNRWVVRSDPVEEIAEAVGQGQEEAPRGMKMGGIKIGDSGGMADPRGGQDQGGGEEGARGAGGESAFEAQVRQNEEFEDEEGGSAPRGGQGEKSSVLSGLSSSRRGR